MLTLTNPVARAVLAVIIVPVVYWIVKTLVFPGVPLNGGAGVAAGVALAIMEYRRSKGIS